MKKKSSVFFRGKLIELRRGLKTLPDKRKVYMEEVSHPGASLTVPVKDGKIIFIRQYRAVVDEYIWELPAGILSPGERPVECAVRELEEETGYLSLSVVKLGAIYTSPGFCDEKINVFLAVCGERGPVKRDEHEMITVRKFSPDQVRKMLKNGRITDSKTISALAMAGVLRTISCRS